MKRALLIAALVMLSMFTLGDSSEDRTKCCHGCGSYGCNQNNCGNACGAGPHCRGCWKDCVR